MKKPSFLILAVIACVAVLYSKEKPVEAIQLTLKDCILKALEDNLDIAVQAYDPEISGLAVDQAREVYWPRLNFGYDNYSYNRLSNWAVEGTNYTTRDLRYNVSLAQQIFTGGEIQLSLLSTSSDTTRALTIVNPSYTGQFALQIRQPILQGFGSMSRNNVDIKKARNQTDISVTGLKSSLIQKVLEVEEAYWNLVYSRESLKVYELTLNQNIEKLRAAREAERIGVKSSLEVLRTEKEVANYENRVLSARNSVIMYEDRLKGILNLPAEGLDDSKSLVPLDEPTLEKVDLSFDEALKKAYAESPDMEKFQKELENTRLDVRYYRNQMLPKLDLEASLSYFGQSGDILLYKDDDPYSGEILGKIEGSRMDSFKDVFGFKYKNWYATLNLTIPLDSLLSKAGLAKAQLEEEKKLKEREKIEKDIYYEVLEAYKELMNREKEIEAASRYRKLAEKNLEAEEQRYNLGLVGNEWLFQYQGEVANAKVSEAKAVIDYKIAVARLEKVMGINLKKKDITFKNYQF
jgi:outer membrane protein